MRWLIAAVLAVLPWPAPGAEAGRYPVLHHRVVDGDTMVVSVSLWTAGEVTVWATASVRLEGVDAPELKANAQCERELAVKALAYTQAWLDGRQDRLLLLVRGKDKYGRLLGDLYDGKEWLSEALLASGHARRYDGDKRHAWCKDA